jgi:hypothetical protein
MSESFVPRRRGAFVEIAPGTWLRAGAIVEVSAHRLASALATEWKVYQSPASVQALLDAIDDRVVAEGAPGCRTPVDPGELPF